MSVKIIHTADLHLGRALPYLDMRAASRRSEILLTLQKITEICKAESADALVISGDLFESPCPDTSIALQAFSILGNALLPVVICAGNHDCLLPNSVYFTQKLPENVTLLCKDTPYVKIGENAFVYGTSFYDYEMFSQSPPDLPNADSINILALHADTDTQSRYNPINTEWVEKSGADYIALGHIHKRSELKRIGNTHLAYSGCPEGQGFDELGACGVLSVTVDKNNCDCKFIPTCRRMHIFEKIDISECADNIQVCNKILEVLQEKYQDDYTSNLYKLHLVGNLDVAIDTAFITDSLLASLYYIKITNKTQKKVDYQLLAKEPNLKGIFVRRMLEKLKTCAEDERILTEQALKLGLAAFDGEVIFNED